METALNSTDTNCLVINRRYEMKSRKQSGFTLVEIAIVLVVIGLLLGGILKGQQLINSARVRNLADQNSGVQAAYYGFVDRFRNLPGDMVNSAALTAVGSGVGAAGGTSGSGGGNGRIDTVPEAAGVWSHLSVAGFLNGTFTGIAASAAIYSAGVANGVVPGNAFQGPILLAHMNDYVDTAGAGTRAAIVKLAYSFGGNIPVTILRDLDQKLDDGVAATGVLRSAADTSTVADGTAFAAITDYDAANEECLVAADWDVNSPNPGCNAIFLY